MEVISNPELQLAYEFVQFTNKNIYLTGKAGTGKTTFLHHIKLKSRKRMIVVAPTGVAAINAGGVTIHSFFQMPFGPYVPEYVNNQSQHSFKFNKDKINILKTLELLIIDEISMVRADLLDGIDEVLRKYRDKTRPFGGVQLLMIGDLHQLAPIVKEEEWDILKEFYETSYFFGSLALQKTNYVCIELTHIFRQNDKTFISMLNKVRVNNLDDEILRELNKRYVPNITNQDNEGCIILTTHNYQSQNINQERLAKIDKKEFLFKSSTSGDFPPYMYPTEEKLILKIGAQVMFIKNDSSHDKLYYNGKIGKITNIVDNIINVRCNGDYADIETTIVEWKNVKYEIDENTKEIQETVIGTFTQIPLKLAWAITIHKSQGLTFERAIIDANSAFASGQVYVALSRCKTLEGLILSTPITRKSVKTDSNVLNYSQEIEENQPTEDDLNKSKYVYQQNLIFELFDFSKIKFKTHALVKELNAHSASISGKTIVFFTDFDNSINSEFIEISAKFKNQLKKMFRNLSDYENNDDVQDRIKKAAVYFCDKIDVIILNVLKDIEFQTDNKAVKKTVNEIIEQIFQETFISFNCLKNCIYGFNVKKYLEIKAKSLINIPSRKSLRNDESKKQIQDQKSEN